MKLEDIEELRPMTALQMLTIWRACREETEDPLERILLCNAQILEACCFAGDKQAFPDRETVLQSLTARQMELLLRRLEADRPLILQQENPSFDMARFVELEE